MNKAAVLQRNLARLKEFYAGLPEIQCQGFCVETCVPVGRLATPLENKAIRLRYGKPSQPEQPGRCAWLKQGRCTIYDARPFICRIWGLVKTVRTPDDRLVEGPWCPYGCKREREISWIESQLLFEENERIGKGGHHAPTRK